MVALRQSLKDYYISAQTYLPCTCLSIKAWPLYSFCSFCYFFFCCCYFLFKQSFPQCFSQKLNNHTTQYPLKTAQLENKPK